MKKFWKTLSSKIIYDNAWIQVRHEEVINPSGGNGIYGVVSFKNIAIGIIPLDEDENTWLIGQFRYTLGEYSWEIPMGGGKKEHTPLAAAQRELQEETGFTAASWTMLMKLHTSNSVTDEVGYVFVAEQLTAGETDFEETEDLKIKKLPFKEVVQMVLRGEITDAISVAGILKLAALRNLLPTP
ncbi:MAG: NUDIX domain-containing protein [Thermoflexibacteraceae bacterium]